MEPANPALLPNLPPEVQAGPEHPARPESTRLRRLREQDELLLAAEDSTSLEQVHNDTQRNQTDKPVVAQVRNQSGKIGNDLPKEWKGFTEQDVCYDPQGNQQQKHFGNLTKPFLHFFQVMHLQFS